ncbi:MAG: hypothetical protein IJJ44_12225 [Solobacterium sp.]|nr:hypothetical protein [Solobacterium sp.]
MKKFRMIVLFLCLFLAGCGEKSYVIGETITLDKINSFIFTRTSLKSEMNYDFRIYKTEDGIQMIANHYDEDRGSVSDALFIEEEQWNLLLEYMSGKEQKAVKRGVTMLGTLTDDAVISLEFGWDGLNYEKDWEIDLSEEEFGNLYDFLLAFLK